MILRPCLLLRLTILSQPPPRSTTVGSLTLIGLSCSYRLHIVLEIADSSASAPRACVREPGLKRLHLSGLLKITFSACMFVGQSSGAILTLT
jgi:hypothetical protein